MGVHVQVFLWIQALILKCVKHRMVRRDKRFQSFEVMKLFATEGESQGCVDSDVTKVSALRCSI